jgi:beta-lactamase regulating signal transducer with metallopeptidase domain
MSLAMIDVDGVAGWLATFALHSTLALAFALLTSVLLRQSAVVLQEALLRWSLWAGLVSASLQCIALGSPWSRQMPWNPEPAAAALAQQAVGLLHDDPAPSFPLASAPVLVASGLPFSWQQCVVAVAIVSALAGLIGLLRTHHRLAHLLAERRPEAEPRVLTTAADVAAALGLRQSPRMSRSDRLATPIAFGLLRPEICLPARVDALGDESLRAMLAHELTHLRHADPAWMWAATWLQALFPWQLLLVAARRRWARLIELRCDAVAARHASSTAVARCLLDIAEWLRPTAPGRESGLPNR